jgi:NAD(P)-dependent dehydrogenase (short-subunit alcohol dehydrogenase family)
MKEFDLTGRNAVVIGASRGLGRRMALALAGAGANLVVASRSLAPLQAVAEEIKTLGRQALAVECDVTKVVEIERLLAAAIDGFSRVDILVNAAGAIVRKPSHQITEMDWDMVIDVNLKGMLFACKVFGSHMMRNGGGKIINIGSLTSAIAFPERTLYAISKAGVVALTKALALEWARYKINVNAIGPGYFETELTIPLLRNEEWKRRLLQKIPLGRIGQPEDLDGITVFLASSASDYVTGQIFFIDGGFLAGEVTL